MINPKSRTIEWITEAATRLGNMRLFIGRKDNQGIFTARSLGPFRMPFRVQRRKFSSVALEYKQATVNRYRHYLPSWNSDRELSHAVCRGIRLWQGRAC